MASILAFNAQKANEFPQADDITAVEILCDASLMEASVADEAAASRGAHHARNGWHLNLTLHGPQLAVIDPVPLLMNQVQELAGVDSRQSALFTILTELFVNALDHGLLQLDSNLKAESNGFENYMNERTRRLAELRHGWVSIVVSAPPDERAGIIDIVVSDSGDGFDVDGYYQASANTLSAHGRGLALVRALCHKLEHEQGGALVKVSYAWR